MLISGHQHGNNCWYSFQFTLPKSNIAPEKNRPFQKKHFPFLTIHSQNFSASMPWTLALSVTSFFTSAKKGVPFPSSQPPSDDTNLWWLCWRNGRGGQAPPRTHQVLPAGPQEVWGFGFAAGFFLRMRSQDIFKTYHILKATGKSPKGKVVLSFFFQTKSSRLSIKTPGKTSWTVYKQNLLHAMQPPTIQLSFCASTTLPSICAPLRSATKSGHSGPHGSGGVTANLLSCSI